MEGEGGDEELSPEEQAAIEQFLKDQEDQFNYPKMAGPRREEKPREVKPPNLGVSERVASVIKEGTTKQEINYNYGYTKVVSKTEALMLRELYRRKKVEELVELVTEIESEVLDKVLSGIYWPYAGDLLKPRTKEGPLPTLSSIPLATKMFGRCVVEIAVETLDADDMDIFCRMLGVTGNKISRAVAAIEPRSQADVKEYLTVSYQTEVRRDYREKRKTLRIHGTH